MLTINAEIKKEEKKLNGTYNVKLRFTLNRKFKRLATSLFATPKDLTKDLKIRQTSPLKREVDNLIRGYQDKCAKLQIELNHYTLDDVMDYLCFYPYPRDVKSCPFWNHNSQTPSNFHLRK